MMTGTQAFLGWEPRSLRIDLTLAELMAELEPAWDEWTTPKEASA